MADSIRNAGLNYLPTSAKTQDTRRAEQPVPTERQGVSDTSNVSFRELLQTKQGLAPGKNGAPSAMIAPNIALGDLRFSGHARTRLQSRNITLSADHISRLQNAVQRAAGKGSRDTLVMMDDLAMVVSVKNRTVVTVVDKENLKQNVFTNIDSAIIA